MTVQTYYRCAVWLPLIVPALVAIAVQGLDLRPGLSPLTKPVQLLLISGLYGGMPYFLLAVYATWWIDGRAEAAIRRRALLAPLWMIGVWIPLAALIGILYGRSDAFLGFAGIGILFIVPLGYAYVVLTLTVRAVMPLADRRSRRRPRSCVRFPSRVERRRS
jgi:hypothetical protein